MCIKETYIWEFRGHLTVDSELLDGGVEEEDEGEGGRQDGVVVEVLPPDARPD